MAFILQVLILISNILLIESNVAFIPPTTAAPTLITIAPGMPGEAVPTDKFTTPTTTTRYFTRTTPARISVSADCDYLVYYCLRAYRTGKICGRTIYFTYRTFPNYCLLDYINCREQYEIWQIVHVGECITFSPVVEYKHYAYDDDSFLDQTYVLNDPAGI